MQPGMRAWLCCQWWGGRLLKRLCIDSFMHRLIFTLLTIPVLITSCSSKVEEQPTQHPDSAQPKTAGISLQLDLADSTRLKHIRDSFYLSQDGHLYERTLAQNDPIRSEIFHEYFNGQILQDIDALTFEKLDGWYAKDSRSAYYYRPTS